MESRKRAFLVWAHAISCPCVVPTPCPLPSGTCGQAGESQCGRVLFSGGDRAPTLHPRSRNKTRATRLRQAWHPYTPRADRAATAWMPARSARSTPHGAAMEPTRRALLLRARPDGEVLCNNVTSSRTWFALARRAAAFCYRTPVAPASPAERFVPSARPVVQTAGVVTESVDDHEHVAALSDVTWRPRPTAVAHEPFE